MRFVKHLSTCQPRLGWPNWSNHYWIRKKKEKRKACKHLRFFKLMESASKGDANHLIACRGFTRSTLSLSLSLPLLSAGRSKAIWVHVEGELRSHLDSSRGRSSAHWAGTEAGGPAPHALWPLLLEGLQGSKRTSLWAPDIVSITHSWYSSSLSSLFSLGASNRKKKSN